MTCRFDSLREHKPSECPRCNPTDWMAKPEPTYSPAYQCTRVGCNDVAVQGGLCAMHDKKEGR